MLLFYLPGPVAAELATSGKHGFTVVHSIETPAEPFVAYRTMTSHIDQWWNGEHSWSGDSSNLYMEVERGGCFCERLPDGGRVEHLRLVYFSPGSELRFTGGLGPLQTMAADGRMIWTIESSGENTRISFTYRVFGPPDIGLDELAPAVDAVIGEQIERLGQRLDRD